jgi:hypothetical protein
MVKIILDFETLDYLKIYFELYHLTSQLEKNIKEDELLDSLEELSLC